MTGGDAPTGSGSDGEVGLERAAARPPGDASPGARERSSSIWSPALVAYLVAAAAVFLAFATPVAVVTSFEGESVDDAAVQPFPQWLVLVGLAIAAGGGRFRRLWTGAFTLGLLFVVLGGLFGAFGGDVLIDIEDSDAGGEIRAGATVVAVAAALAAIAIVVDCRAHLARIAPRRPHPWAWAVAVVVAPLVATVVLVTAAIAFGGGSSLVIVVIAPVIGAVVGGSIVRRWEAPTGRS